MNNTLRTLLAVAMLVPCIALADRPGPVLVIHGGAGTLRAADMSEAEREQYEAALHEALDAGWRVLAAGGSALDAVTAAILPMEDSPLFNAGRGAVFTADGRIELDASVMDGATQAAGAVGGVRSVRNPVLLARRVMEASPHVFLAGPGALEFAIDQGLELKPAEWFWTERRWQQLQRATLRGAVPGDAGGGRFGTVGAVALDASGRLAAATSTGAKPSSFPARSIARARSICAPNHAAPTPPRKEECAVPRSGGAGGAAFPPEAAPAGRVEPTGLRLPARKDHGIVSALERLGIGAVAVAHRAAHFVDRHVFVLLHPVADPRDQLTELGWSAPEQGGHDLHRSCPSHHSLNYILRRVNATT